MNQSTCWNWKHECGVVSKYESTIILLYGVHSNIMQRIHTISEVDSQHHATSATYLHLFNHVLDYYWIFSKFTLLKIICLFYCFVHDLKFLGFWIFVIFNCTQVFTEKHRHQLQICNENFRCVRQHHTMILYFCWSQHPESCNTSVVESFQKAQQY